MKRKTKIKTGKSRKPLRLAPPVRPRAFGPRPIRPRAHGRVVALGRQETKKTAGKRKKTAKVVKSEIINGQENFELDYLLIDEQISYSTAVEQKEILRQAQDGVKPVINELDKLIEGEKLVSNFSELLPQSEIKISLNKKGQSVTRQKTHQLSNSAYLLDLKKGEQFLYKLEKPPKRTLGKLFSRAEVPIINKAEVKKEQVEVFAPTLLRTKRLSDKLNEFVKKVQQILSNIIKHPRRKIKATEASLPLITNPRFTNLKIALNFAFVALLLIVPIRGLFFYQHLVKTKGQVLGVSEEAWQAVKEGAVAASQLNWEQAGLNFNKASNYFTEAQRFIEQYNKTLLDVLKVIPTTGKKISSAESLLRAGKYLTLAVENLAQVFQEIQEFSNLDYALTDDLAIIQMGLTTAVDNLEKATNDLNQVDSSVLPDEYRDYFAKLPVLQSSLIESQKFLSFALAVLGHNEPKRYLFMFQNTNELRPTGGFFGSFALVDIKKGEIINMEVPAGGTYDLKGYFTKKVISPAPLHLLGTSWQSWDANWFADFPTSAKKIIWFFENSGWPTFDGIIAINSSIIPKLLEIVGDIEMTKYDKVLTPKNVVLALQHATLFEYNPKENRPKEIITDLMPALINRLLTIQTEQILPLLLTLNQSFQEKEIQFYFTNSSLQEQAAAFGLIGEMLETAGDYLLVVDTNIGGGKTNAYIKQEINDYVYVQPDGSVIKTVAITRRHNGHLIDPTDANYVFAKVNNVSFIKIYVPQGSEFLEATGYKPPAKELFKEIYSGFVEDEYLREVQGVVEFDPKTSTTIYYDELNKTAFGHWIQVEPGQESTLTFSYCLPFKIEFNKSTLSKIFGQKESPSYSLLIQKQSGAHNVTFKSFLFLPENFEVEWLNSTDKGMLKQTERGVNFTADLTTDQYYAVVLKEK